MRNIFEVKMESKRQVQLSTDNAKALEDPQAAIIDFERAQVEWQEKKEKAWLEHLRNTVDEEVKEVSRLEIDRLLAIDIENEVDREDKETAEEELKVYDTNLKTKHPILYLSKAWRKRKVDTKKASLEAAVESTRLERVANRLEDQGHEMQSAIRKLAFQFRNEVRAPLADKLRSRMSSFPPATFEVLQLKPKSLDFSGGRCSKQVQDRPSGSREKILAFSLQLDDGSHMDQTFDWRGISLSRLRSSFASSSRSLRVLSTRWSDLFVMKAP